MDQNANATAASATNGHAWERWGWIWDAIFYGLLVLSAALMIINAPWSWRHDGPVLALAAAMAGWYWALMGRAPWHRENLRLAVCCVAGLVAMTLALLWLEPTFHLVLFSTYGLIYSILPVRWAIPGATILSAGIVARIVLIVGLSPEAGTTILLIALGNGVGIAFALWISAIITQSGRRQDLIEELATTRRELVAAEREAGVMAERQRLAGEIHDTLAQGFVSIVTHLEAAEAALDRTPSADSATLRRHLDDARRAARENLAEARRMVWALRPELLVGGTLPEAIERVARRWAEETGLAAAFTMTGTPRQLAPESEVALLRATQEALTNIRRHAGADHVAVTISYLDDVTILDVQDNGHGFDPADLDRPGGADLAGGFGLRAMRERVAALGGHLSIESAPGEGTTLAIELPLSGADSPPGPPPQGHPQRGEVVPR